MSPAQFLFAKLLPWSLAAASTPYRRDHSLGRERTRKKIEKNRKMAKSRKGSRKASRKSTRKNARRSRKATTRKQRGGFFKRFFGSKAAAAPAAPAVSPNQAAANRRAAAKNAAQKYVNAGVAAGKKPYYLYMDAEESGVNKNAVKNILKAQFPENAQMKQVA
jgi:hypothetical protein